MRKHRLLSPRRAVGRLVLSLAAGVVALLLVPSETAWTVRAMVSWDAYDRLPEISAPTLVLHGTEDPLFPLPHGQALAAAIPGARLVPLDGVGHEIPPSQTWDEVVPQLLGHTEGR